MSLEASFDVLLEFIETRKGPWPQDLMFCPAKHWLQRHQPGTPFRQIANQDTGQVFLFGLLIVCLKTGPCCPGGMPGGMISEEHYHLCALGTIVFQQGLQKTYGVGGIGLALGPRQERLLGLVVEGRIESGGLDRLMLALGHTQGRMKGGPGPKAIRPAGEPGLFQPDRGLHGCLTRQP